MTNIVNASITNATFLDDKSLDFARDKSLCTARNYIGVIGSRTLPAIYKPKVKEVVRQALDRGYDIASGGAVGADNYALEALLELGAAHRGIIFSPWQHLAQFPIPVRESMKKFHSQGGRIVWGNVPPAAPYPAVAAGLLSRNVRLVEHASALAAFPYGISRGTAFTVRLARQKRIPVFVFNFDREEAVV